jgi:hypothetical protein
VSSDRMPPSPKFLPESCLLSYRYSFLVGFLPPLLHIPAPCKRLISTPIGARYNHADGQ